MLHTHGFCWRWHTGVIISLPPIWQERSSSQINLNNIIHSSPGNIWQWASFSPLIAIASQLDWEPNVLCEGDANYSSRSKYQPSSCSLFQYYVSVFSVWKDRAIAAGIAVESQQRVVTQRAMGQKFASQIRCRNWTGIRFDLVTSPDMMMCLKTTHINGYSQNDCLQCKLDDH